MKILYFGEVAEITDKIAENVLLKDNSLSELVSYLLSTYELAVEDIHIAINHTIVSINEPINLKETDEIAVLSPFAGG